VNVAIVFARFRHFWTPEASVNFDTGWKVKSRRPAMRIGELARRTGVDPRLLRYYEQQGLLRPERHANGYRDYADSDVATVAWIRRLLGAGLSTATIAEFQDCAQQDDHRAPADCQLLASRLGRERHRIDAAMADLAATRSALDEMIATATTR
jgi:DNA-binding transcriptional MerR regulator